MPITYEDGLLKVTTTKAKGSWTYIKTSLPKVDANHNILKLVVTGTENRLIKVKFDVDGGTWETGNPEIKFTGKEQTLYFLVPKAIVSESKALIFIDGNYPGSQVSDTQVTIKEIALCEALGGGAQTDEYADYDLLDWQPTFGHYNSQDVANSTTIITYMKNFVCSGKRFTKEELPVGSIIVIEEGWQYRPDGWDTENANNTGVRPGNVTERKIVIDEAWWGNYIYRAFNVSSTSGLDLTNMVEEAGSKLKIYVPKK